MTAPASKAELLQRIGEAHAHLEAMVAQLTPEQLIQPDVHGEWSVKDDLAHVTWWEQRMLGQVQGALRGEKPTPLAQPGEEFEAAINRTNNQTFAKNRNRSLADILAERQRSFSQVIQMMESLSEADVADPSRIEAVLGGPLLQLIAGDTYDHYHEHAEAIRNWLERQSGNEQR